MEFALDFFRDEVRNGFYIPTAIKQSWAASLTVLSEIDRICEKYGITYFADWGTILGAVRHGGFVPWDDDLDICMRRDDYIRFREVADAELPEEFVIHDYERKENHWLFLSRVVNNSKTCFTRNHLDKYHNFPYMCAVDIFIQDYLYKDQEEEKARCEEVKRLIAVADGIVNGKLRPDTIEYELSEFEHRYNVRIDRSDDVRLMGIALYRLAEQQMARVSKDEADRVGQIFPWVLKGNIGLPKEYYEKIVRLPFENTTIPVPACYNEVLRSRYGNYLEIHKVWTGHDYPYFEKQREQLQAVSDHKLPEFEFTEDMLLGRHCNEVYLKEKKDTLMDIERIDDDPTGTDQITEGQKYIGIFSGLLSGVDQNSYKYTVIECMNSLSEMTDGLKRLIEDNAFDELIDALNECQQLSVDLGTFIEEIKGEERNSAKLIVKAIEEYCDALYEVYLLITEGGDGDNLCDGNDAEICSAPDRKADKVSDKAECDDNKDDLRINTDRVKSKFHELISAVKAQIIEKKEILFLPTGPKEWKGFEHIYDKYNLDSDNDIYIVPLPVLFKDSLGRVTAANEEIALASREPEYPESLMLTPWTSYDVKLHHPDMIYIQDPYDGENPCLTVPPQFYAGSIREYTDELIFVPAFKVDEFHEKDYNDVYNMKHYVTAPGVIYADKVMVQSENMKEQYVRKLTEFAGEKTRDIWCGKIHVLKDDGEEDDRDNGRSDNRTSDRENDEPTGSETLENYEKKKILYCIGLNELSEHKDNLMDSVKERLEIFEANSSLIDVTIAFNPIDIDEWKKVDDRLAEELFALIKDYEKKSMNSGSKWCDITEMKQDDYENIIYCHDAYYGSASPLVPMFVHEKKPVMISSYGI